MAENHFVNNKKPLNLFVARTRSVAFDCFQIPTQPHLRQNTSKTNWSPHSTVRYHLTWLNLKGKIYVHTKELSRLALEAPSPRQNYCNSKYWSVILKHAFLHANNFVRKTAQFEGVNGVFKLGNGRSFNCHLRNNSLINRTRQIWGLHNLAMDWNYN